MKYDKEIIHEYMKNVEADAFKCDNKIKEYENYIQNLKNKKEQLIQVQFALNHFLIELDNKNPPEKYVEIPQFELSDDKPEGPPSQLKEYFEESDFEKYPLPQLPN